MRGRFLVMLAFGLGLMGFFWWKTWEVEDEKAERATPVKGCATAPNCPEPMPVCLTDFGHPDGVCTAECKMRNQCPENWCCPPPPESSGSKQRHCVPPHACAMLGLL